MAKMIEPPSFISDTKNYTEYKADLLMWSRISSLDKKVQAEMVVYRLDGHPSHIKEKIMTQIGEKLKGAEVRLAGRITSSESLGKHFRHS